MLLKSLLSKRSIPYVLLIFLVFSFIPAHAKELKSGFSSKQSSEVFADNNEDMESGSFAEVAKLMASDGEPTERFGHTVVIDGDTLAIGTIFDDDNGTEAGSVYIFERLGTGSAQWELVKKVIGNDTSAGDHFGAYLDIDGDTLIVGAYLDNVTAENSGSAYVFERNVGGSNNWGQVKKLISSDNSYRDRFGWQVKLSGDTVVIGAYLNDDACPSDFACNSGAAYIFERNTGGANHWGEVKKITANDRARDDMFSWGLDIENDTIIVGAVGDDDNGSGTGSAYIFMRDWGGVNNWGEVAKISASDGLSGDQFGNSITFLGNTLVVGARYSDARGINSGAAYIFERDLGDPTNWVEAKKLVGNDTTSGDEFGDRQPAIDGNWIVIGAGLNDHAGTDAGASYIFERNLGGANNWGELAQLTASDAGSGDTFGYIVDVQDQEVFVGARFHDGPSGIDQGAVYVYADENTPLMANDDSGLDFTTNEASPFTTGNVLSNDVSSNPLSVIGFDTTNTAGLVTNNGDGTFAYHPNGQFEYLAEGQQAFDTFEYTVADTTSLTDTATVTITVIGLNDAPMIESANLLLTPNPVNENASVLLSGSFTDLDISDAHSITINWGDGSTNTLNLTAGVIQFESLHIYLDDNPTRTASDLYSITVTVADGLATADAVKSVTLNNVAPILSNLAVSMDANGLATLTGIITDPGTQDVFSLKMIWGDGTWTRYSLPAGTTTFTVTHLYTLQPGLTPSSLYTIKLNLNDDDSGRAKGQIDLPFTPIIPTDFSNK